MSCLEICIPLPESLNAFSFNLINNFGLSSKETFHCYEMSPRKENSLLIKRQFSMALDGIIHLHLSKAIKIRDVNYVCCNVNDLVPPEAFDQIKQRIELNSDLMKWQVQ